MALRIKLIGSKPEGDDPVCRLASSLEISPRLPSEKIAGLMFSKRKGKTTILPVSWNLFYLLQKPTGSGT